MSTSIEPVIAVTPMGMSGRVRSRRLRALYDRFLHIENSIHHQLVKHSIAALRIALGLIFLGFGILKFFPGVSPAQAITEQTTHVLFLGLVPGLVAMKMIATLECVIGICLLSNRGMRLAVWLLGIEFIGILAPVFLFPGQLFSGPHHAPTLLAQYCLKDIILVAGALVVAAGSFRGGRMIRTDLPPNIRASTATEMTAEHKLRVVLDGISQPDSVAAALERHSVTESDFHDWRETVLLSANRALSAASVNPVDAMPAAEGAATAPVGTSTRPQKSMTRWTVTLLALALLRQAWSA